MGASNPKLYIIFSEEHWVSSQPDDCRLGRHPGTGTPLVEHDGYCLAGKFVLQKLGGGAGLDGPLVRGCISHKKGKLCRIEICNARQVAWP